MKFAELRPGDVVINYEGRLARLVVTVENRRHGWDIRWLTLWNLTMSWRMLSAMFVTNYGMNDHMHEGYVIWRGTT